MKSHICGTLYRFSTTYCKPEHILVDIYGAHQRE